MFSQNKYKTSDIVESCNREKSSYVFNIFFFLLTIYHEMIYLSTIITYSGRWRRQFYTCLFFYNKLCIFQIWPPWYTSRSSSSPSECQCPFATYRKTSLRREYNFRVSRNENGRKKVNKTRLLPQAWLLRRRHNITYSIR